MSGKDQEFPITFNALIDHGSSSVLIRKSLTKELGLRHRHLRDPFSTELAMENDKQKIEIQFSDYVKLQLHDPSTLWSSKTMRAIVAPGLCAPMILGLPFLKHNDIIVDASACTAIDKKSAFNLLNPVIPIKPVSKQKLKDYFEELQADRKRMVTKLKLVCQERKCMTMHSFEAVKPVDIVAAIRERIESLAAQDKLKALGTELKSEFRDVFALIPHLNELPTDVYCHIRLGMPPNP